MYVPDGERSRAVLIGTSEFTHLPDLPAVKRNIFALFRALTHAGTGIMPDENCDLVQNPDSPDAFMRALRRNANEAEDLLIVYYAGHGLRHQKRDDLYLTVQHTNPDGLDGSAVGYDWVKDIIADSSARTRLLILDCCYAGLAIGRMSGTSVDERELVVTGTSVMASVPSNKQSHSPAGERYTAYTAELIALLERGSPFADEPLSVTNAHRLVKAALARKLLPVPRLRSDDTCGDVMLRRMPPKAPEPVSPRPVEAMPPKPALRPPPVPVGPPVVQRPSEPKEPPPQRRDDLDEVPVPVNAGRQLERLLVRAVLGFFCVFALGSAAGGLVGAVAGAAESRAGDLRSLFG